MLIPVYRPSLGGNEKRYVNECLDSNWISSRGKFIGDFERAFAEYSNVSHSAAVCNGTVALHLALLALDIGPGDEVIVPTLTYISPVNAVRYVGATPVFADSLASTWQLDASDVERKITPNTRAIIAVHLYGHPCDMHTLCELAERRGLFLIEDCAEAFGSRYRGRHVGGFGHIATYSFYGNKTITTGEGGMVVTNDGELHERVRHYKGQGLVHGREYWHDVIGYNYRMTNICAAIGLAQLERADELLARKRQVAAWYAQGFDGLPVKMHNEASDVRHSFWMCTILVDDPPQREQIREHLVVAGIETRPVFFPIHTMPMYAQMVTAFPVAEDLALRGINLPSWPDLTYEEVQRVVDSVSVFFEMESCQRGG